MLPVKTSSSTAQPTIFISAEPLTLSSLKENKAIQQIYTDKEGNYPPFIPSALKPGGSAFGTLFKKCSLDSPKQWVGKIGESKGHNLTDAIRFQEINIAVILEKLASDFYEELGRGSFLLPKTLLSEQPMVNSFGPDEGRWFNDKMFSFIKRNQDKTALRIMSRFVKDYSDFKNALCLSLEREPISFIQFLQLEHRPPTHLLTPEGKEVPLEGFIEMVAVGRILADTDILGGSGDNAGFVWVYQDSTIISAKTVKIDPGCAFTFDLSVLESITGVSPNCVINTYRKIADSHFLNHLTDLQMAQNNMTLNLHWSALTPDQKKTFLQLLLNASRYIADESLLSFLFFREGKFCSNFPQNVAKNLQEEMEEWIRFQLEIYQDELDSFLKSSSQKVTTLPIQPHVPASHFSVIVGDLTRLLLTLTLYPAVQKDGELKKMLKTKRKQFLSLKEKDFLSDEQLKLYLLLNKLITQKQINLSVRQELLEFGIEKVAIQTPFLKLIQTDIENKDYKEAWQNLIYHSLTQETPLSTVKEYVLILNQVLPQLPLTEKGLLASKIIPTLNLFPQLHQEQASFARQFALWHLHHRKSCANDKKLETIDLPALFYFSQALLIFSDETIHLDASQVFEAIIEDQIPFYLAQLETHLDETLSHLLYLKTHFGTPRLERLLKPCFQKARTLSQSDPRVTQGLLLQEKSPPPRTKVYLEKALEWEKKLTPTKPLSTSRQVLHFQKHLHEALVTLFHDTFLQDFQALLRQPMVITTFYQETPHGPLQIDPCHPMLKLQLAMLGHPIQDHPCMTAALGKTAPSLQCIQATSFNPDLEEKGNLFQALLAFAKLDPSLVDIESQLLSPFQKLLQRLSSHYDLHETHPLDQIHALPFDAQSQQLLEESYLFLYTSSLTSVFDQEQLKKTYWLGLRPLFHTLKKALYTKPSHLPSLYETAVQEIWWIDDPTTLFPLLDVLVPDLLQNKAPVDLHQKLYTTLSSKTTLEPFRAHYIQLLKGNPHLIQALASIPDRAGLRYEEKQNQEVLLASIQSITQPAPTQVSILLAGQTTPLYLKLEYAAKLLSSNGDIQDHYDSGNLHNVASLENLHFKQKPFHPLMEYAVYTFTARLMGVATPPTILAKIHVKGKQPYPVLISQTIPGKNLKDILKQNPHFAPQNDHFTWQVLLDILLRPGDKKANNHIVDAHNQLICIDNDISFVEPVLKEGFRKTINFCSILFSLSNPSLLDTTVLETFRTLNPDLILEHWLQDLIAQEKHYQALFSETEINALYKEDKDKNRFTPTLLLPAGAITTLYTQFLLLQQFLSENKPKKLRSTDLLDTLITLKGSGLEENRIGPYLKRYYQESKSIHPEEKLKVATKRDPGQSILSSRALGITTGTIPTAQEIHQKRFYSLEKAYEEFIAYSLIRGAGNVKLATLDGKQALSVDFTKIVKEGKPDIERQSLMLKGLQTLIALQKLAPTSVSLTSCAALTQEGLKPFLHEKLMYLDLRGSSLDFLPPEIETLALNLEELYLSGCPELYAIEKKSGIFGLSSSPIALNHLKVLHAARCPKLGSIQLSVLLNELKVNNNPQLKIIQAPSLIANSTNSPQVKIAADFQPFGKHAWATHFGDIGEEPPLPPDIAQILNSACPIWPGKKTYETHILILIPKAVNGEPLTLKSLGELIQNPKTGPATKYGIFDLGEYQDKPAHQSYWVLMTRDVLEGSRNKDYKTQFAQVEAVVKTSDMAYVPPKVLEAAVCILMHHVSTGKKLYSDSPWTYTRCEEFYEEKNGWKLVVGGFSSGGLGVGHVRYALEPFGVAGVRKFLGH